MTPYPNQAISFNENRSDARTTGMNQGLLCKCVTITLFLKVYLFIFILIFISKVKWQKKETDPIPAGSHQMPATSGGWNTWRSGAKNSQVLPLG